MSERTSIEWTEATWNPVTGCTKVSPGCAYCYAERITTRLGGPRFLPSLATVRPHPERLQQPLRWKRPRLIFTCSMSDLFHEDVPTTFLADVFETMRSAHWHIFQVLTKRPERMRRFFEEWGDPPSNVWLGVSVENQRWANTRIPVLLEVPARVRFVSCEPLLGRLDLSRWLGPHAVNWVIVGGESGGPPNRRLVESCTHPGAASSKACTRCSGAKWVPKLPVLGWVRSIREQCQAAGIPFFFKQWGGPRPTSGGRLLDGQTWDAIARNEGMVPIDQVGPWSKDKLDILTEYLKKYATIMNNQKKVRSDGTGGRGWLRAFHYIDAFSGTGKAILRANNSYESRDIGEYLDGSPVRAIKCDPPFDRLWFIERDKKRAEFLKQTVREIGALNGAAVLVGDANVQLCHVVRLLGRQER
jgi:protein gp37